jgi:hypothetical protein
VASNGFCDLAGLDALRADVEVPHGSILDRLHPLDVRTPNLPRLVVCVGYVVPEAGPFAAKCALSHGYLRNMKHKLLPCLL